MQKIVDVERDKTISDSTFGYFSINGKYFVVTQTKTFIKTMLKIIRAEYDNSITVIKMVSMLSLIRLRKR